MPERAAGRADWSGTQLQLGLDVVTESTTVVVCVIVGWIVVWTILGAWRMATRDA